MHDTVSQTLDEIRADRLRKRELLEARGMLAYRPHTSYEGDAIAHFLGNFDALEKDKEEITVAGRVMAIREHGGSIFFDLFDGTGKLQAYLKRDASGALFDLFQETVDRGDFLEVSGTFFATRQGQQSILASSWSMLSKSLLPIPTKWFGIKDDNERYRARYLDLLLRDEARELFSKKALFWETMRHFMWNHGFLEVETPSLETTTGGAEARPFKTHHNDFDIDVYLRISVGELWQKRLVAAGFPRTFEIGRVYRNEGSSPEHLQEFTNMEFYAAYMNFNDGKELIRDLYIALAKTVFGTTKFERKGFTFDLADTWKDIDYVSTVKDITGIDVLEASDDDMKRKLDELDISYEGENRERMTDSLWKFCRKQIGGPAFLVNHPGIVAPLSKVHTDDPRLTFTTQPIIAGSEMGRAHAELNDPIDQRTRFMKQQELLEAGDEEAMMPDWDFVEMLEYGMPPTFGFGCGERFFALLAGVPIREAQLFPLMRPRQE